MKEGNQHDRKLKCELYHDSMQSWKSYAVPKAQLIICDIPYCYDGETECFTIDGWKRYNELTYDDVVLSLNPATMEMEYSGIDNIIIKENTERMVSFNTLHMNLFVTENHRMFAKIKRKSYSRGIRNRKFTSIDGIRLAKDVNTRWHIPRSGYIWKSSSDVKEIVIPSCTIRKNKYLEETAPEVHIPLEKWLPFFGLWVADGCTSNAKAKNGRQLYMLSIKQFGDNRKIIMDMLKDFPFKVIEYEEKNRNCSNISIHSKQLWLYLNQFGKARDKFIPRWILDLPIEYLSLFWKWYTFGDSHKNGNGLSICTVSKKLAENLQEIALKLGTICHIYVRDNMVKSGDYYEFQYNPNSKNITYGSKKFIDDYNGIVWCITLKTNSVFLVRRKGKIAFCGNCVGTSFYGSSPLWYKKGDNKNGESELAKSMAFYSDQSFNLSEFWHFAGRLLKKEPKTGGGVRGRSSDAPCMIVFCSFEQMNGLIEIAKKKGFMHYIPLFFFKNYSPQVLKANMRVVGATEHALLFYRDRLPKFRNNGKMVFNWFPWESDGKEIPKIHPTQKPVKLMKKLITTFTDPYDVVIDVCFGSGSTARACIETNRNFYGFEISKEFYTRAKNEMCNLNYADEIQQIEGQMNITDFLNVSKEMP